jgi:hypothetical protein
MRKTKNKNKRKKMTILRKSSLVVASIAMLMSGCAQDNANNNNDRVAELEKQIADLKAQKVKNDNSKPKANSLVPTNAKTGECYARVLVPAEYKTITKKVMTSEGTQKVVITPASYKMEDKKMLAQEESYKCKLVPATYKTVTEKVMVAPAKTKLVNVPAKYKKVKQKILVKKAYSTWKKGRGEIEKTNNGTGEIMCLIQVPAVYKTVVKTVLDTPATTKKVVTPAVYKTVSKKVVDVPAKSVRIKIPAVYKTIKVQKLVKEATSKVVKTKPVYKTVKETSKTKDSYLQWKRILCETNTTPNVVSKLQTRLNYYGAYNGKVNGKYDTATKKAVAKYQKTNKLPSGALTLETLNSLGVK